MNGGWRHTEARRCSRARLSSVNDDPVGAADREGRCRGEDEQGGKVVAVVVVRRK